MKKILHILLALIFGVFTYLNLNDPDAMIWVLAYASVAVLFALSLGVWSDHRVTLGLAAALSMWMLTMLPGMMAWFRDGMPSITEEMKATEPHIEVVREFLGLLIAVTALVYLGLSQRVTHTRS
jgi:hypothetical protein